MFSTHQHKRYNCVTFNMIINCDCAQPAFRQWIMIVAMGNNGMASSDKIECNAKSLLVFFRYDNKYFLMFFGVSSKIRISSHTNTLKFQACVHFWQKMKPHFRPHFKIWSHTKFKRVLKKTIVNSIAIERLMDYQLCCNK